MIAKRVLIVEDDPFVAIDVQQALTEAGYEVCGSAASEAEALAIARATHPDFAVVDVHLAPGDGRDVARELIAHYDTAVLMATSECDERLMASAIGRPRLPAQAVQRRHDRGLAGNRRGAAGGQRPRRPAPGPYGPELRL